MGSNSKDNVYKEIILQQQQLLNEILIQLEKEPGEFSLATVKGKVEDLGAKIEALFPKEMKGNEKAGRFHRLDNRLVGFHENNNSRSSHLRGSSLSPNNRVGYDEILAQNTAHKGARVNQETAPLEGISDRPVSTQVQQSGSEFPFQNEDVRDTRNFNFDGNGMIFEKSSPSNIQYVSDRASPAAPIIPEKEKSPTCEKAKVKNRIVPTESIPLRESSNVPLAMFGARTDSIPEQKGVKKSDSTQSLRLITTTNVQITPFKIQVKRGNPPTNQTLSFIFKISLENRVIGFIMKSRIEFVAIEQAIRSAFNADLVQLLGPFPEKSDFSGYANGKETGVLLHRWLSNAIAICVDFPPLLDFLNSNVVFPPIIKDFFKKQGTLTKKGNYFGGLKTRHYSLDVGSGTVFYSDVQQSEILGSFSLQYAYTISMPSHLIAQNDTLDKPGFIVAEYKKAHFSPNTVIQEGKNQDGLPLGKIDVRHVFYSDTIEDRDSWVRSLSGVIAKLRPNDFFAQELFAKTAAPEQRDYNNWSSLESLTNSNGPSVTNSSSNVAIKSESLKSNWQETVDKWKKGNVETDRIADNKNRVQRKVPAAINIASPSNCISTASSPAGTSVTGSAISSLSNMTQEPINESERSPLKTVAHHIAEISQGSPISRSPQSPRPKPKYVDDQARCMQQDLPLTLAEMLDISPARQTPDNRKKMAKGKFSEWVKQAAKNSADILKDKRDTSKPTAKLPIFGVTIQESALAYPIRPGVDIPVIVYRCIEFLDVKKAADEEGLYRLSGASSMISALKQKFEEEGDVPLLEMDEYYDPHAIAGLLKLFFRELAEPLFTFQLRMNFFQIAELPDRDKKIAGTIELLRKLPSANYACLRSLLAHLLRVVKKSDINKMTVRNISIVFSPTLGVPAGLFTLMLAEFSRIFSWGPMDPSRMVLNQPQISIPPAAPSESSPHKSNGIISSTLKDTGNAKVSEASSNGSTADSIPIPNDDTKILDLHSNEKQNREDEVEAQPARSVSQAVKSQQNAIDPNYHSEVPEDADQLLNLVISPTALANQFLSIDTPDEDFDMMKTLQNQLDSLNKP